MQLKLKVISPGETTGPETWGSHEDCEVGVKHSNPSEKCRNFIKLQQ